MDDIYIWVCVEGVGVLRLFLVVFLVFWFYEVLFQIDWDLRKRIVGGWRWISGRNQFLWVGWGFLNWIEIRERLVFQEVVDLSGVRNWVCLLGDFQWYQGGGVFRFFLECLFFSYKCGWLLVFCCCSFQDLVQYFSFN